MRPLTIAFSSRITDRQHDPLVFFAAAGADSVSVRGGLSAGSLGWFLTAHASRHRRQLTVYVTARRCEPGVGSGVEDHNYEATLSGLTPGRYYLRICHVYLVPGLSYQAPVSPIFELALAVPAVPAGAVLAPAPRRVRVT